MPFFGITQEPDSASVDATTFMAEIEACLALCRGRTDAFAVSVRGQASDIFAWVEETGRCTPRQRSAVTAWTTALKRGVRRRRRRATDWGRMDYWETDADRGVGTYDPDTAFTEDTFF